MVFSKNLRDTSSMLPFFDFLYTSAHGLFVVFILFGWVFRPFRKIHAAAVSLTALSWFGLGWIYGWGYCPLTDWHWSVKMQLGETDLPYSFITYYLEKITGRDWNDLWVDRVVMIIGVGVWFLSVGLYLKDGRKR